MKTQEETTLTTYSNRIVSTQYSTKVTPTGGRHGRIRKHAPSGLERTRRRRLVIAVVAILPGEPKQGRGC